MRGPFLLIPILFFAFLLLFGLYFLSRYIGIKKLSYRRYFTQDGVFEGEDVFLVEEIDNAFFLPLFFVDVEAYIYADLSLNADKESDEPMQSFCSRFFLLPFTRVRRKHPVHCTGRGYYRLETIHIYFARDVVHLDAPAEIYVYPRLLPVEESAALNREIQNNSAALRNLIRDPFSFAGLRDYRRGDPFGSLNFKATARTGTLKVNERDPLSNRDFMIYINYQSEAGTAGLTPPEYERRMEQALSYASYLIRQAIDRGYKTGFSANAETADGDWLIRLPRAGGAAHYAEILKAMAKIRNAAGVSFVSLMTRDIAENMTGAEVFLFTLYVDERIREAVTDLQRLGNTVSVRNLLPAEESL